jgi:hypothetical protein
MATLQPALREPEIFNKLSAAREVEFEEKIAKLKAVGR